MKNLWITICILIFSYVAVQAATYTVSNKAGFDADYTSLQSAHNGASNGDTLLIQGTAILYRMDNYQYFNKKLVIIGSGLFADQTLHKRTRIASNSWGRFILTAGASGAQFFGVDFVSEVEIDQTTINVLFENCQFNGPLDLSEGATDNLVVRNCIFNQNNSSNIIMHQSAAKTVVFDNCVFDGYIQGSNNSVLDATFNHCLFHRQNGASFINFPSALIVRNSIFLADTTFATGSSGCTFDNNLSINGGTLPPTGNNGSSNLTNADPLFKNYTSGQHFSSVHDYDVQGGSPVVGAASDGTDIGIHGGYTYYSKYGEVLIVPMIRSIEILNSSVRSGGTLNVHVKASKPHSD